MLATENANILDVTILPPREKHPTIFSRFDLLQEGETLTILNDHDPKPLYYQLLGERGNVFTWEYLEQGPEWWKVSITKRKTGEGEETIGQLVARDFRKAEIFKKYGLDFCCGGKKTVRQACEEKGLDFTKVENELQGVEKTEDGSSLPYGDWSLAFLADFIVNTHHTYVLKNLPQIRQYAKKVAAVHGAAHPELHTIHQLVEALDHELSAHLVKEEKILFPYIKQLETASKGSPLSPDIPFSSIQAPVNMMETEHEIAGQYLEQIRQLSGNYKLPQDACASYTLLFKLLDAFERDLHIHIHLENNILFPKALQLEKELKRK